jgi:peptidoglycan/LPS O-acetylase OafA/YrhL
MSSRNLYRIGGISAILSVLLEFFSMFRKVDVFGMGGKFDYYSYLLNNIFLVLIAVALYYLYSSRERTLSLAALLLSIIGVIMPLIELKSDELFLVVWVFSHIVPILLFGIAAYQHPQAGLPRTLAIIGILYAVIQIAFYALYNILPDLNLGVIDNLPLILSWGWMIWVGVILLTGKTQDSPKKISTTL